MKALQLLVKTNNNLAPLIARLMLGLVMFPHGAQKMLGWFGGHGFTGTMNFPSLLTPFPPPNPIRAINSR